MAADDCVSHCQCGQRVAISQSARGERALGLISSISPISRFRQSARAVSVGLRVR
jgi:hypothetical protein